MTPLGHRGGGFTAAQVTAILVLHERGLDPMIGGSGPTALAISIRQALDLLDGDFAALAQGIAHRRYAFWLGSGISRDRVDDLKGITVRVLTYLRDRVDTSAATCPFRGALEEALSYADLSPAERSQINISKPVTDWPGLDTVIDRLTRNYARLLDIRIEGKEDDHLLWEAVDVVTTYAPAVAHPDCEHLCIAILAIEGVIPEIASANWDGLIEAAVDDLTKSSGTVLQVCVRAEDLREAPRLTRLLKFHGCAVRAATDPVAYRHLLVARLSQISAWKHNSHYALMRHQLVQIASTNPTLMIGLSAQDSNIQDLFAEGQGLMTWEWPSTPPAFVFAEEDLGRDQLNILKFIYSAAYSANRTAIDASARLRAFAKPLLTALVLHVLCTKLVGFSRLVDAPQFAASDYAEIELGLKMLRNRLSSVAGSDRLQFIRSLVDHTSRAIELFQEGANQPLGAGTYRGISALPVHMTATDPSLTTSGIREAAAALALLGAGEADGSWSLSTGDLSKNDEGVLLLSAGTSTARVFFAANSGAAAKLEINSIISASDRDAILIHSTSPVPRRQRSPRAAPGRTGRAGLRSVVMKNLLDEATSIADLQRRFREEAAL